MDGWMDGWIDMFSVCSMFSVLYVTIRSVSIYKIHTTEEHKCVLEAGGIC